MKVSLAEAEQALRSQAAADMATMADADNEMSSDAWKTVWAATRTTGDVHNLDSTGTQSAGQLAWVTARGIYAVGESPAFARGAGALAGLSAACDQAGSRIIKRHTPPTAEAVELAAQDAGVETSELATALCHLADANLLELADYLAGIGSTFTEDSLRRLWATASADIPPAPPKNPDDKFAFDADLHF